MIRRSLALAGLAVGSAAVIDRALARALPADQRPGARPIRSLAVVDAPLDAVWAAISDIPAQPRWMREMKSVRPITPGPPRVGWRGEADVRIFGIGVSDPVEITAWDPPGRFAVRHLGLFAGGGEIVLRPGADGTTTIVTWDETLVPPVLPEVGAIVLRPMLRRIFQDDLHRFGRLVGSGAWTSGAA
jgi:uncharacterized membrane protein